MASQISVGDRVRSLDPEDDGAQGIVQELVEYSCIPWCRVLWDGGVGESRPCLDQVERVVARSMKALTEARIAKILGLCKSPAAASRASERIYKLSERQAVDVSASLLMLSNALNEHRHVMLADFRGDRAALEEHTKNRDEGIKWALRYMNHRVPVAIQEAVTEAIAAADASIYGRRGAR